MSAGEVLGLETISEYIDRADQNTPFVYRPLSIQSSEIRLLTLHGPEPFSGLLGASIDHYSLQGQREYVALSYCWGTDVKDKSIRVNGRVFAVTENLHHALWSLRDQRISTVWVDAICIKQDDPVEKSSQIQQMMSIYRSAYEVIVWLGPAYDCSDFAMDVIHQVGDSNPENIKQMELRRLMQQVNDSRRKRIRRQGNDISADQQWDAILSLLRRPYWARVWILQELAAAVQIRLVCGTRMTDWDNFMIFLSLPELRKICHYWKAVHAVLLIRERMLEGNPQSLMQTPSDSSLSKATDLRDKIYALLGITVDGTRLVPVPNYTISLAELYQKLTVSSIISRRSLDIICLQRFDSSLEARMAGPTWSPDWLALTSDGFERRMSLGLDGPHGKSASRISQAQLSQYSRILARPSSERLQVSGWCLGEITVVGTVWSEDQSTILESLDVAQTSAVPARSPISDQDVWLRIGYLFLDSQI